MRYRLQVASASYYRFASLIKVLLTIAVIATWCALLPEHAVAQNVQYTNKSLDVSLRGTQRVNPATRALEIEITLGSYPGRGGLDVPVTLAYSSKVWGMEYQYFVGGPPPGHGGTPPYTVINATYAKRSAAGWTTGIGFPSLEDLSGQIYGPSGNPMSDTNCSAGCYIVDRVMIWMPDGSGRELRSTDQPLSVGAPKPDNLYALDGSGMRYRRSDQTLFLPDGSRYLLSTSKYIDRNGNTLTFANGGWRDTLDRQITSPLASAGGDQIYSLPGVGGTPVTYTLKWRNLADVLTTPQPLKYIASSGCPPGTGNFTPSLFESDIAGRSCINNGAGITFNPVVLSQILLPTGQSYTFTYDVYGAIDKVVLPTGGYEKYQYAAGGGLGSGPFVYNQASRGVVSQVVSPSGSGTDEVQWQYSGVSITAPDGTRTERYQWGDSSSSWGYGLNGARAGRAYDERIYSSSGQMVWRKLTDWAVTGSNGTSIPSPTSNAGRHARVAREVEILLNTDGNALAKTTTYGYDTTYQYSVGVDRTSVVEYDYVVIDQNTAQTIAITSLNLIPNGTRLRTTESDYLTSNQNYRDRNLLGLATASRVRDGGNNIVAQNSISYDEASYSLLPCGAAFGWSDPGATVPRGLVTTTGSWLNTTGTYLLTHAQYDQCGSPRKSWDSRDYMTEIEYSSASSYAYPTRTISPDPDGLGPVTPLITSAAYDLTSGRQISATDANNKTTTFEYLAFDAISNPNSLQRLTKVIQPDGGSTAYGYSDTPGNLFVVTKTALDGSRFIQSKQYADGLGRTWRNEKSEGASSIYADTKYDDMGRTWKSSNPYRSGETLIWTTIGYDNFSRSISVTTPDGSQANTAYGVSTTGIIGTTITVTDQTLASQGLKKSKRIADALGRLREVYEDPTGLNYLTSYSYDTLNNLTTVTQGSQTRTFAYDSLKRLTSATNPEVCNQVGAQCSPIPVTYEYDNNGNLWRKVDARGVTTTHSYDALNRNTLTDYSDATPDSLRQYDLAINGIGRLNQVWQSGSTISATNIDSYDAMGRPKIQRERFQTGGVWSSSFQHQRNYNFAGGVISQTYPSGRTVSYTYDEGGRTNGFTGNLGDGVTRTYSSAITYSAFGGVQQEQFGTQVPLYHKLHYNVRGQLFDVRLSTVGWTADQWNWNRGALAGYYSQAEQLCQTNECRANSGPGNNGNMLRAQHFVPANDAISNYNWTDDSYQYDSLNRLTSVAESHGWLGGSSGQDFKQIYQYDQWGNRTIDSATVGAPKPQFTASSTTNRLGVPVGQAGRMDYDSAGNLANDSYTSYGRTTDAIPTRLYDAENRLTTAKDASLQVVSSYSYNADGRRTRRKLGSVETWQVYGMDGELLAEYSSNGAVTSPQKEYGYRDGELLITAAAGAPPSISTQNVTWTSAVGVNVSGNSLQRVSGGYFGGAVSSQSIASGDGYVEFTATETDKSRWFGLANGNSNVFSSDIDFAIALAGGGTFQITNGNGVGSYTVYFGNYTSGDVFRVGVEGGAVTYRQNGVLLYTSATAPSYPLLVDTSLYQVGCTITNAVISGNLGGGSGPSVELNWLVSDHLGTPRMVVDQTGALASVKRHDYLPFGEELGLISGRTTVMGYGAIDVRQKFTSYERDSETGLDYAQARYYSSIQGRFASVDPQNAGARETDPQTWNGYAYARNNPQLYIDPSGKEITICDANGKNCQIHTNKDMANIRKNCEGISGCQIKDDRLTGGTIVQDGEVIATFANELDGTPGGEFVAEMNRDEVWNRAAVGAIWNVTIAKALSFLTGRSGSSKPTVAPGVNVSNPIRQALSRAKPTPHGLEATLDDGTKVIFRKDFGSKARPVGPKYPQAVDHYNVEVHTPLPGRPGRFKQEANVHIVVDNAGNVVDVIP